MGDLQRSSTEKPQISFISEEIECNLQIKEVGQVVTKNEDHVSFSSDLLT